MDLRPLVIGLLLTGAGYAIGRATSPPIRGNRLTKKDLARVPKELLKEGADVEMEHTTDRKTAEYIAAGHILFEDHRYYSHLKKMETDLKRTRTR